MPLIAIASFRLGLTADLLSTTASRSAASAQTGSTKGTQPLTVTVATRGKRVEENIQSLARPIGYALPIRRRGLTEPLIIYKRTTGTGATKRRICLGRFQATSDSNEPAELGRELQGIDVANATSLPLYASHLWGVYNSKRHPGFPCMFSPLVPGGAGRQPDPSSLRGSRAETPPESVFRSLEMGSSISQVGAEPPVSSRRLSAPNRIMLSLELDPRAPRGSS
jgi:hypothetical protein